MEFKHITVLLQETVEALNVRPDHNYIDATLGGGGHAYEILKRNSPKGLLLGIDQDPAALVAAKTRLSEYGPRAVLVRGNFKSLKTIVHDTGINKISGIVLDLGVSSYQLSDQTRGFSFMSESPLDMRMGEGTVTAAQVVNNWPLEDLVKILKEYGEERFAQSVARAIVKQREIKPLQTTLELVSAIELAYRGKPKPKNVHLATKTFQAIRIAVNDELGVLKNVLSEALEILEVGGRLAVISFHSLEDRIVKDFIKENTVSIKKNKYAQDTAPEGRLKIINKKPLTASKDELNQNPRSRSAKLRVVEKQK